MNDMENCFSFDASSSEPEEKRFDRNRSSTTHSEQTRNDDNYNIDGQLKSGVSQNSRITGIDENSKQHQCPKCNKIFGSEEALVHHSCHDGLLQNFNFGTPSKKCTYCVHVFSSNSNRIQHELRFHKADLWRIQNHIIEDDDHQDARQIQQDTREIHQDDREIRQNEREIRQDDRETRQDARQIQQDARQIQQDAHQIQQDALEDKDSPEDEDAIANEDDRQAMDHPYRGTVVRSNENSLISRGSIMSNTTNKLLYFQYFATLFINTEVEFTYKDANNVEIIRILPKETCTLALHRGIVVQPNNNLISRSRGLVMPNTDKKLLYFEYFELILIDAEVEFTYKDDENVKIIRIFPKEACTLTPYRGYVIRSNYDLNSTGSIMTSHGNCLFFQYFETILSQMVVEFTYKDASYVNIIRILPKGTLLDQN